MRIGRVVVIVVMPMVMMVIIAMMMRVVMVVFMVEATRAGAKRVAERTVRYIGTRRTGSLALDMVMMALLWAADLRLETEHLGAVFAHGAIHQVFAIENFGYPLGKGFDDFGVVV